MTAEPIPALKKRYHDPYRSDFGRFCRPLGLMLVLALPFPFWCPIVFLPFSGSGEARGGGV